MRRVLAGRFLAAAIAGCGGDSTEPKPTITGTWNGTITGSTGSVTLTLQQAGTQVTGNGTMVGPGGSAALTVTGSFTPPSMSLSLASAGFQGITYAGWVTGIR